jgi:hypothetical protein
MRIGFPYRSTSEASFPIKKQKSSPAMESCSPSLSETLMRIGVLQFKQAGKLLDISEIRSEHNFTDN